MAPPPSSRLRRTMDSAFRIGLVVTLLVTLGPALLVACACRSFLYHPTRADPAALAVGAWQAAELPVAEGIVLRGLVRPPRAAADEAPRWILFFGGNAMSLLSNRTVLQELAPEPGIGLATFAYRGYDGSGGRPKEEHLLADAETLAAHLEAEHGVRPDRLVILGQSLGTGVAIHLAAALARKGSPPAGLGLLSPYTSMSRVFDDHVPVIPVGWAVTDSYRSERLAPELTPPIVIVHGDRDEVIPVYHARRLAEALGERVRYHELPGRHHNDLWDDPGTLEALRGLLR
ncbi:MAG: alpha/beta hydrolase fold domain-containing protein [Deltaproteobacteria bacterium]|nr:alpha/beta hydrolase fold domain-containing protein [Deltaproteobacteria bacterium]